MTVGDVIYSKYVWFLVALVAAGLLRDSTDTVLALPSEVSYERVTLAASTIVLLSLACKSYGSVVAASPARAIPLRRDNGLWLVWSNFLLRWLVLAASIAMLVGDVIAHRYTIVITVAVVAAVDVARMSAALDFEACGRLRQLLILTPAVTTVAGLAGSYVTRASWPLIAAAVAVTSTVSVALLARLRHWVLPVRVGAGLQRAEGAVGRLTADVREVHLLASRISVRMRPIFPVGLTVLWGSVVVLAGELTTFGMLAVAAVLIPVLAAVWSNRLRIEHRTPQWSALWARSRQHRRAHESWVAVTLRAHAGWIAVLAVAAVFAVVGVDNRTLWAAGLVGGVVILLGSQAGDLDFGALLDAVGPEMFGPVLVARNVAPLAPVVLPFVDDRASLAVYGVLCAAAAVELWRIRLARR